MTQSERTDKDALVVDDQSSTKPHGDLLMPEAAKQDGLPQPGSTGTDTAGQQPAAQSTPMARGAEDPNQSPRKPGE